MSSPYFVANANFDAFNDRDAAVIMFGLLVCISSIKSWFKGKYPFKFSNLWVKLNIPEHINASIYDRRHALLKSRVDMIHSPHFTLASLQFCTNYPLTSNAGVHYGSIGQTMTRVASSPAFREKCERFLQSYHTVRITNNRAHGYAMLGDSKTKYLAKCFTSEISNIGKKIVQIFADEIVRCYPTKRGSKLVFRNEEFLSDGKEYMGINAYIVDLSTGTCISVSEFPAFVIPMYYYANDTTCHITIASSTELQTHNPQMHADMEQLSQEDRGDVARNYLVRNTCFPSIPIFCVGDCTLVVQ